MTDRYGDWIASYRQRAGGTLGMCFSATKEMAEAFPELRRERGFVTLGLGGSRSHWWMVASDGTVLDPTADQFDRDGGIAAYRPYEDGQPIRVGCCPNCGDDILVFSAAEADRGGFDEFCDEDCGEDYARYLSVAVCR